ncbi:MAG: ATP-dependent helicase [Bradyrhizobium sp.]|uniref:ATP-dependent helicase n=1 Tax=Bradyrhizobium sp. TaxID=376 RepID=UPI0025BD52C5|nr:ATP-dependent helicase [Bradyrhizobium sp.]MBI5262555.1 ATP-dependent helicase [Bradyrhizobium sp.]
MAWDEGLDKDGVAYKIAATEADRVRVIAGPGTGKSYAMKRRVARLLEEQVEPENVLAVTFTRVAAEDLHRELQKLEVPGCEKLEGQTLHGLAMRILAREHVLNSLGRTPRPLNNFEQKAMYCDIAPVTGGKKECKALVEAYEAAWARSQGDEPGFPATNKEKAFQKILLDWHIFHKSMLIGEVIPYLVRYLKDNPAADEHTEFDHVLADEYQDLNKAEQTAIAYLAENAHICIVGDDDQSIYSFKSAHPDGIREWKDVHAECADFEMADCQRCPTTVVAMANSLISHNKNRDPRELKPIEAKGEGEVQIVQLTNPAIEAKWIGKKVKELLDAGVQPSEIIVLVQRKRAARVILKALKAVEVPAKSYYEESQLETDEAQKRFAMFKLLLDKEDRVALRYLLGIDSNDFRAPAYARVREHCENSGDTPFQAMEKLAAGTLELPHVKSLIEQFNAIGQALTDLDLLTDDMGQLIDMLFPADVESITELRELALSAASEVTDAHDLFSAMMKEITQPDIPPEVKEVRVMSLHKSKGLSSPFVFIAQCVQGVLPQISEKGTPKVIADAALEEARRLFFVGVTRVKAGNCHPGSLYITYPKEMLAGMAKQLGIPFTKSNYGQAQLSPSIFLQELGPSAPKPVAGKV